MTTSQRKARQQSLQELFARPLAHSQEAYLIDGLLAIVADLLDAQLTASQKHRTLTRLNSVSNDAVVTVEDLWPTTQDNQPDA